MTASNLVIVLKEPQGPLNVGAVCRVMMNFGCSRLRLVNPCEDFNALDARKMALGAIHILEQAAIFSDLETALADIHTTFGTTRRFGKYRKHFLTPATAARTIARSEKQTRCAGRRRSDTVPVGRLDHLEAESGQGRHFEHLSWTRRQALQHVLAVECIDRSPATRGCTILVGADVVRIRPDAPLGIIGQPAGRRRELVQDPIAGRRIGGLADVGPLSTVSSNITIGSPLPEVQPVPEPVASEDRLKF